MREGSPIPRYPFTLPHWVPLETMLDGHFNYWTVSSSRVYDGRTVNFRIGDIKARDGSDLNIVIASESKKGKGKERMIWYFEVFRGEPSRQRSSKEEIDEYEELLRQIPKRKNRVAGKELKGLIETTLKDLVR